jgi:hypothetical protein
MKRQIASVGEREKVEIMVQDEKNGRQVVAL